MTVPAYIYGSISRGNVTLDGTGRIQDLNTDPVLPFVIGTGDSNQASEQPAP